MNANETILRSLIAHDDEWERLYQQELAALLAIMDEAHDRALSGIATLWGKVAETKEHIDATYTDAAKRVKARLDADMPSVGKDESAYIRVLIGEVAQGVALKSSKILWAEVAKLPAASGLTLYQLADNMAVDNIADVVTTVQQGLQAEKTLAEVVRELRGSVVTRAKWVKGKYVPGVYEGGVMTTDTRETEMFARTAIMHVGNSARDAFYDANADIIKAYMRVEVLDERTCIECGIADGKTYKVDEPRPSLPAHPNCVTGDTLISSSDRVSAVSKRIYNGDLFIIRTASGNEIRVTPNHPILTSDGFVAAKNIRLGQNLVRDNGINRVFNGGNNDNQIISSAENLFSSLLKSSVVPPREVPQSTEDFHGDGTENEVAIIATNGELLNKVNTPASENISECVLVDGGRKSIVLVAGNGGLNKLLLVPLLAADGITGGLRKALSFFRRGATHTLKLLFVWVSCHYTRLLKYLFNIGSPGAKFFSNAANTNSGIINRKHFFKRWTNRCESAHRPKNHTGFGKSIANDVFGYTELARHILNGLSGPIALDKVVDTRKINFSGHVYNLQTNTGWFIANNIITHNCRGVYVPVLKSYRELGVDVDELPAGNRASMDGAVPQYTTWRDVLAKADDKRLSAILGPTRARLYRNGMKLDSFVKDGKLVPIKELVK